MLGIDEEKSKLALNELLNINMIWKDDYELIHIKNIMQCNMLIRPEYLLKHEIGTFCEVLFLYERREYIKCFSLGTELFCKYIRQNNIFAARTAYAVLARMNLEFPLDISDRKSCLQFLIMGKRVYSWVQLFPWLEPNAFLWLERLRRVAESVGSTQLTAFFDCLGAYLYLIRHYDEDNDIYIHKLEFWSEHASYYELLPYFCFYYYIKGNYIKSINTLYKYDKLVSKHNKNFVRVAYIYGAVSSCMMCEYDIAIDILNTAIHIDENNEYNKNILLSHIGNALIIKHDYNNAINIINKIIEYGFISINTYHELYIVRILSYYHFKHGRINESYNVYKEWLLNSVRFKTIHYQYVSCPFMMEMQAVWNYKGLSSIHSSNFIEELTKNKNSGIVPLMAISSRLLGQLTAMEEGWAPHAVQYLEESLALLRSTSMPMELAKTLFALAHAYRVMGQNAESKLALQEAKSLQKRYDFPDWELHILMTPGTSSGAVKTVSGRKGTSLVETVSESGMVFPCSEAGKALLEKIKRVASTEATVLILGESGVGKEICARELHKHSGRTGRLVTVNMANVPLDLFESTFYGHERGSFTGALNRKIGLCELADNGTFFIDEVGDMPPLVQVKLLRVLQERQFMRVGGNKAIYSDFRIICATNKDLKAEVEARRFREDLYYRLNVVTLRIPPLRERRADILPIAEYYLHYYTTKYHLPPLNFSSRDRDFLLSYRWPGNIRELKNFVERLVVTQERSPLPLHLESRTQIQDVRHGRVQEEVSPFGDEPSMKEMEERYFCYIYKKYNGRIDGPGGIAEILGMSRATAYLWAKKLRLSRN